MKAGDNIEPPSRSCAWILPLSIWEWKQELTIMSNKVFWCCVDTQDTQTTRQHSSIFEALTRKMLFMLASSVQDLFSVKKKLLSRRGIKISEILQDAGIQIAWIPLAQQRRHYIKVSWKKLRRSLQPSQTQTSRTKNYKASLRMTPKPRFFSAFN